MSKNVLILGASSDIGKDVTKYFLKAGYNVFLHYNNNKPKIKSKKVKFFKYNFNKIENYKNFINKIKNIKFSSFVNLIGYIDNRELSKASFNDLNNSLKINFIFPILISNYISTKMIKAKYGRILHCSSIGVKFGGGINTYTYALAKHCLEFIPQHYKINSKSNVLYNILRIGVTDTKIHKRMKKNLHLKKRLKLIPIERMAKPREIALYILNLITENNSYMTGQTITVSGGE